MAATKSNKYKDLVQLLLVVVSMILLVYISSFYFHRFDLTSEKRHTLSPATRELMSKLKDVVYVRVYLKGDFPADYKRLQQATKEKLDELRAYSNGNLEYEFIDPSDAPDEKTRTEFYYELVENGLNYLSLQIREKDGIREQIIFPGAILTYNGQKVPIQILGGQERIPDLVQVNNSINNLEYEFANAITQLVSPRRPKIAFVEGHGELNELETKDFENELLKLYDIGRVRINGQVNSLSKPMANSSFRENLYDAIIIAKPDSAFSEQDKYMIDQFVMYGGKVMWLLDPMKTDLDSLRTTQVTMAVSNDVNLDDQLFKYGVRLNKDLIIDRNCAPIGLMTGMESNQRMELFPWYFKPISIPVSGHPIVNNVEPVVLDFVSSIDTLPRPNIRSSVLLTTSPYSRIYKTPVRVSLNIVKLNPDFSNTTTPNLPVAVLLEGKFESVFKNRLSPAMLENKEFGYREESPPNRMIVISDGDIVRNDVDYSLGRFRPLGYDRYAKRKVYGNREFLMNAMNYLLGDIDLIQVRSRTIALRKLDDERILNEREFWQVLNIGGPVVLVVLMGLTLSLIRRRRYAK